MVIQTQLSVKQRSAEAISMQFKTLMDDWLNTTKQNWGEDTYNKDLKSIKRHIYPAFGQRDFSSISPKEWFDFFQGLQLYILKLKN